jgi:hypothetical protein
MNISEERLIAQCLADIEQIRAALQTDSQDHLVRLRLARTITNALDSTSYMSRPGDVGSQIQVVQTIQTLATSDRLADSTDDLATWCERQYLMILSHHPNNVPALTGNAQLWVARAQPSLARISQSDRSSSGDSARSTRSGASRSLSETSDREADQRAGTADYVEARTYLEPAIEFYERAVTAAGAHGAVDGRLLATVRVDDSVNPLGGFVAGCLFLTLAVRLDRQQKRTSPSARSPGREQVHGTLKERSSCCGLRRMFRVTRA